MLREQNKLAVTAVEALRKWANENRDADVAFFIASSERNEADFTLVFEVAREENDVELALNLLRIYPPEPDATFGATLNKKTIWDFVFQQAEAKADAPLALICARAWPDDRQGWELAYHLASQKKDMNLLYQLLFELNLNSATDITP